MVKILVIEKKAEIQTLLDRLYSKHRMSVDAVRGIGTLPDKFRQSTYDIVICDTDRSNRERSAGLELLKGVSQKFPQSRIIMVTDQRDVNPASDSLMAGRSQWIQRPVDEKQLCTLIDSALQKYAPVGESGLYRAEPGTIEFEGILGVSLPMLEVFQRIMEASATDISVLITGETGTGKDLVAVAIHKRSKRRDRPYIAVNTGALASELIASALFGHEKGAYTGASESGRGRFEEAHTGTIFLDEISTMDDKAQISLLRVLETRTFRRVGGEKDLNVDVRVIAATNENLEEAVKQGRFREDLFYRLDVFRIHLPPLRDRPGGVTFLTNHFVPHFSKVYGKNVRRIAPETLRCLRRYPWPGNVRELKNVIQRAVLMAKGEELTPDLIPARIQEAAGSSASTDSQLFPIHVGMTLQAVEKEFIRMTLESTGGNKKEAARILGISRRALYNKLKRHGLL